MTSLERKELPTDLLQAIQASLPSDEVIRHATLAFNVQSETQIVGGRQQEVSKVASVFHLAVTDTLVASRVFKFEYNLTDEQIREKQALESEVYKRWPLKGKRVYSDEQVIAELYSKYGKLDWRYLPEIVWSNDSKIADVTTHEFVEDTPAPYVTEHFAAYTHQKSQICYFRWSGNGWSSFVSSFFGDLFDIYSHIRNVQSDANRAATGSTRITKCTSCGSSELTVRGPYTVCDYCQSKFGR